MATTLILTHGRLALELLEAARVIVGDLPDFQALALEWTDGPQEAEAKLRRALEEVAGEAGVLILTDVFGGTPFRAAAAVRRPGAVEVVSGVNLPMVVRLACGSQRGKPVRELAEWIVERGRSGIALLEDDASRPDAPCQEGAADGGT